MENEITKKVLLIPDSWIEEASRGIARLKEVQPCYFIVSINWLEDFSSQTESVKIKLDELGVQSALLILPNSLGNSESIPFWPSMVQSNTTGVWICSLHFADNWQEVEDFLSDFQLNYIDEIPEIHISCQYQLPYTDMLKIWSSIVTKSYHPGDFFKEDFLLQLSQMEGTWVYWGHAAGDRLRGYGHLKIDDLLSSKPAKPLLATLWFTCSTLNPEVSENIGLQWYLSGSTKCLLASPSKINTEANQFLGKEFLSSFLSDRNQVIAEIFLTILRKESQPLMEILSQYHLLGIPWVRI